MGKTSDLYKLYTILSRYSDEEHQLSMKEILEIMEKNGCKCSEDTIQRYLKQLVEDFSIDIISSKGRNARYFIGGRLFQNEELQLLIQAISTSNFLNKSKTNDLIQKLVSTVSEYDAKSLRETSSGISVAKTQNNRVLINVNKVRKAFEEEKQISFKYMKWDKDKKLTSKESKLHTMNPWKLIWANDRYYLYGYDTKKFNNTYKERCYRVDKMTEIKVTEINREGKELFEKFDSDSFVSKMFDMYISKVELITIEIPETLIGAFFDQFGLENVEVKQIEDKLEVTFEASTSKLLYGWLIGMEDVKVVKPDWVKEEIKELIESNNSKYAQ